MEIKALPAIVLSIVMVGMILGVGILILDNFAPASAGRTTITTETGTFDYNSTIYLANSHLVSFTSLTNSTGTAVSANNYTVDTTAATITIGNSTDTMQTADGDTVTIAYIYNKFDTNAQTALNNVVTAAAPISTTWLPLIVTVIVLSIILVLVIRSFGNKR